MSPAFSDRFISVDCSDTLADNLSWRKFSKRLLYSPNLLTAVGFTKILAEFLCIFNDIFVLFEDERIKFSSVMIYCSCIFSEEN